MRFHGKLYRDGRWWLAEVPMVDALTQGRTRREAIEMVADWFLTMAGDDAFDVRVEAVGRDGFEVRSDDSRAMIRLLLRRQRQRSGLSLAEVAARLGVRSKNAYARYEQGLSVPTVDKLERLLRAITPDSDLLLDQVGTG